MAGAGLGVTLLSVVAERGRLRALPAVLIGVGSLFAGYFLGGGIDELLRRIDGDDYTFAPALGLFGAALGVVWLGFRLLSADGGPTADDP